jgi:two-component system, LytTR family, response regulator
MIRALIIDDEKDARFLLRNLLEQDYRTIVEVVDEADDVDNGIAAIQKHKPDLVFLDIQMPQGTGFDLLQKMDHVDFEVVFITAYDNYAIQAFQFSAFGYLLKPIKAGELNTTIHKLENHLQFLKQGAEKRLKVLIENYGDDRKIRKLVITNMEGFKVVNIDEILRLEGDRNYTHFIVSGDTRITTSKTLAEYEELLNDHGFFRIHQSTIVNLRHVKGYIKGDGGTVEMTDGKQFQLARNRKQEFMEKFIG